MWKIAGGKTETVRLHGYCNPSFANSRWIAFLTVVVQPLAPRFRRRGPRIRHGWPRELDSYAGKMPDRGFDRRLVAESCGAMQNFPSR